MIMMQAVISAAVAILVASCGGASDDLLDSTESVCDEFAAHAQAGLPANERPSVVSSIGEAVGNAADAVNDAYAALERTASSNDSAYQLAADAFA